MARQNGWPWKKMLLKQRRLNDSIANRARWVRYPWYRAFWVEMGKLADFVGSQWKWWAGGNGFSEEKRLQAILEAADALHFALSDLLAREIRDGHVRIGFRQEQVVQKRWELSLLVASKGPLIMVLEDAVQVALEKKCAPLEHVFAIFRKLDVSVPEKVADYYFGKSVLNVFRQDNGYKNGSYIKKWNGKEDNMVLAQVIAEKPGISPQELYHELARRYPRL